jgi:hypothetical protein
MVCVGKSTVSHWASVRDFLSVTKEKVHLSELSSFQPTHARELVFHFRKRHGKDATAWDDDVRDTLAAWVEAVEEHDWTVQEFKQQLAADAAGAAPRIQPGVRGGHGAPLRHAIAPAH